jgi:cobalt/nickel transport system permease protein
MAMLARGFSGEFHTTRSQNRFGRKEVIFMGGWITLFILLRAYNAPELLGSLLTGAMP